MKSILSFRRLGILFFLGFILFLFFTANNISRTKDSDSYHGYLFEQMEHSKNFKEFTDYLFRFYVTSDSITTAYTLKQPDNYHIPKLPANLSSFTINQYNRDYKNHISQKRMEHFQTCMSHFHYNDLSNKEKLTYTLLQKQFNQSKALSNYPYYEDFLGPTSGISANLPVTLSEYPIRTKKDIQTYLALLKQIPDYFDNIIAYEKNRAKQLTPLPDFLLVDTRDGLSSFVKDLKSPDNCFLQTFEERLQHISGLSLKEKERYQKRNRQYIQNYVLPAFTSLLDYVNHSLSSTPPSSSPKNEPSTPETKNNTSLAESSARNKDRLPDLNTAYGLSTLPHGKDYYTLLSAANTGSSMTPAEMITRTENELINTLSNVKKIALENPEVYLYYCDHPVNSYYQTPDAILQALTLIIREDYPLLKSIPSYQVKSVPNSLASHLSPAFYMIPAIDDYQNHTIYINPLYTSAENGNLFTTLAHEGFPGHLYQTVYFNSTNPHAIRQTLNYPGFVEGWATYVELNSIPYMHLPKESQSLISLYQADTLISLALSSRVDLGVNYENWTLNHVNAFLQKYGFQSYYAGDLYAYVVESPATYLRYFIGYLEMEDLRQAYQNQTMEKYSSLDFHKKILSLGPADFSTLRSFLLTTNNNH